MCCTVAMYRLPPPEISNPRCSRLHSVAAAARCAADCSKPRSGIRCATEVFTGAFWFTFQSARPPDWTTSCCGGCTHVTTESNGGGYVLHFSLAKCGDAQTGIETRLCLALPVPLRGRFEFGNFLAERVHICCVDITQHMYRFSVPESIDEGGSNDPMFPPRTSSARALLGRKSSSNGGEERMKR